VAIQPIANAVYGQATDGAGQPISGAVITVYSGGNVAGTVTTQSDGTYAVGGLAPGPYRVRLQAPGAPESWFAAYAAAPGGGGYTGNPTAFSDPANEFRVRAYPNPVRDGPIRIAFSATAATSAEVKIFDAAGRTIITLSADAPGPGWHEVEWDPSGAANGVYFYQVEAGGERKSGRFALLKRRP
jgi:large repetitive protein